MLTRDLSLWEAVDLFYGCNQFVFYVDTFWAAYCYVIPNHFARLRIMDLIENFGFRRPNREDWADLCMTIARMPNLRNLYMRLEYTSELYEEIRKKHRRDDLPHFTKKIIPSPRYTAPISEKFILDSLYQIKQVREFNVRLDARKKGQAKPEVRSDSPFTLLCESAEEMEARREREARWEREARREEEARWVRESRLEWSREQRQRIEQQQEQMRLDREAKERRLMMAQREADLFKSEQGQKAEGMIVPYQSVPRW